MGSARDKLAQIRAGVVPVAVPALVPGSAREKLKLIRTPTLDATGVTGAEVKRRAAAGEPIVQEGLRRASPMQELANSSTELVAGLVEGTSQLATVPVDIITATPRMAVAGIKRIAKGGSYAEAKQDATDAALTLPWTAQVHEANVDLKTRTKRAAGVDEGAVVDEVAGELNNLAGQIAAPGPEAAYGVRQLERPRYGSLELRSGEAVDGEAVVAAKEIAEDGTGIVHGPVDANAGVAQQRDLKTVWSEYQTARSEADAAQKFITDAEERLGRVVSPEEAADPHFMMRMRTEIGGEPEVLSPRAQVQTWRDAHAKWREVAERKDVLERELDEVAARDGGVVPDDIRGQAFGGGNRVVPENVTPIRPGAAAAIEPAGVAAHEPFYADLERELKSATKTDSELTSLVDSVAQRHGVAGTSKPRIFYRAIPAGEDGANAVVTADGVARPFSFAQISGTPAQSPAWGAEYLPLGYSGAADEVRSLSRIIDTTGSWDAIENLGMARGATASGEALNIEPVVLREIASGEYPSTDLLQQAGATDVSRLSSIPVRQRTYITDAKATAELRASGKVPESFRSDPSFYRIMQREGQSFQLVTDTNSAAHRANQQRMRYFRFAMDGDVGNVPSTALDSASAARDTIGREIDKIRVVANGGGPYANAAKDLINVYDGDVPRVTGGVSAAELPPEPDFVANELARKRAAGAPPPSGDTPSGGGPFGGPPNRNTPPTIAPPTPPHDPPGSAVERVIAGLREARPLQREQRAIYRDVRKQRIAVARDARTAAIAAGKTQREAFAAERSALGGELPKVHFNEPKLQESDIEELFRIASDAPDVSFFESVNARGALDKMLRGEVPQKAEIALLQKIYGPDLADELLAKRPFLHRMSDAGLEVANLPRSVMASFDLSAPFRQGIVFISKPRRFSEAFRDMFKYAFSEKAYQGLEESIRQRPTYELMRDSGLAITDLGSIASREERFASNLAEKIPGIGRVVRASGRAYTGFLSKLRADVFDDLVKKATASGVDPEELSRASFPGGDRGTIGQDIASFVNAATGRGPLPGAIGKAGDVLNAMFFSPRLMSSRLTLLNPAYYVTLDPLVRREALRSMLIFAGAGATVVSLAKLSGADVETDMRSSDFGKIRSGNTRIDTWGGFQQYVRMAAQLASNEYKSATSGRVRTLGEGYKPVTRYDILLRQIESKEAPIASFVTDLLRQQDYHGNPVDLPTEVADRFTPMLLSDMHELYKDDPSLAPLATLGAFGFGVQNFEKGRVNTNAVLDTFGYERAKK